MSREQRAESREQRAWGKEQRAEGMGQRAESREQKIKIVNALRLGGLAREKYHAKSRRRKEKKLK